MRSYEIATPVISDSDIDWRAASLATKPKRLLVPVRHADPTVGWFIACLAHNGYVDVH
jgi:hypothetical protein